MSVIPSSIDRMPALARAALARPGAPAQLPARLIVVDVERQRLALIENGVAQAEWPISTARAGVGGQSGSLKTPPGWHLIRARIGHDAPPGTVFESRARTGEVWRGEPHADDLILTRILTLEGLEPGVNQGPGVDSLERYIYIHATNHEALLGSPASHGCVRMAGSDAIALFNRVAEGDPVLIAPPAGGALAEGADPAIPDPRGAARFHYAGIGGSGMSALAQFQVMSGGHASGSDRAFDQGERNEARAQLERLGIRVTPQDGSGLGSDCTALVVSTAVESDVPDVAAARTLGLPVIHRSALLAHFVAAHRTIAVAGTSGKSTVVAMIFEILRGAGRRPSVITGGDLVTLQREGLWGNAWSDGGELLVVEADESDGSLVRYTPAVGVVLNLQKDHKEMSEVAVLFETFRSRVRETLVCGEDENLAALSDGAVIFGFGPRATVAARDVNLEPDASSFAVDGVRFQLPVPGRHNVVNAIAAIAACRAVGVETAEMVAPLAGFLGVGRRFQVVGRARDVEVIDDFAHNPAKLEAAIETAQRRAGRVLAVFQPHGYGPTRFLRPDLVESFASTLRAVDRLWLLEVFYAGGTARRDFSAADIVAEIAERGTKAEFAPSRPWLVERLAAEARAGDLVLVMGARDPSLTGFARDVVRALEA